MLEELFLVNGKVPLTFAALVRPGFLTTEWLEGRRSRYVRPFRLYLVAAAIFVVMAPPLGGLGGVTSAAASEGGLDAAGVESVARGILLFGIPILAVVTRYLLSARSSHKSLIPHFVFSLHYHTVLVMALIVALGVGALLGRVTDINSDDAVGASFAVLYPPTILYFFVSAKRVFHLGLLRLLTVGVAAFALYGALSGVGASLLVRYIQRLIA